MANERFILAEEIKKEYGVLLSISQIKRLVKKDRGTVEKWLKDIAPTRIDVGKSDFRTRYYFYKDVAKALTAGEVYIDNDF